MHPIYSYINKDKINFIDNFSENESRIYHFTDVKFRTSLSSIHLFQTMIAMKDNKIINTSNKLFSFLTYVWPHPLWHEFLQDVGENFFCLQMNSEDSILIEEPVFQFFDFDSVRGVGESYDTTFYLLYKYFKNNMTCKLLIPKTENIYYKRLIQLLRDEFHVDFLEIDTNKVYHFKEYYTTRTYMNVFFKEVKEFINEKLILPIMKKFEEKEYTSHQIVARIKFDSNNKHLVRQSAGFEKTENYINFCKSQNVFEITDTLSEQEKIYYLNKANKIIVSWGSIFYINIHYYIASVDSKYISVIFNKNIMPERVYLKEKDNSQWLHTLEGSTGNYANNIYTQFVFKGEVLENISNIDEFVNRTSLLLASEV